MTTETKWHLTMRILLGTAWVMTAGMVVCLVCGIYRPLDEFPYLAASILLGGIAILLLAAAGFANQWFCDLCIRECREHGLQSLAVVLVALGVALVYALPGRAGGCYSGYSAYYSYPSYYQAAPVTTYYPVVVPLYSFQYTAPPVTAAATQQVVTTVTTQAATQQQVAAQQTTAAQLTAGQTSGQQAVQQQTQALNQEQCDVCAELRSIREEIARLRGNGPPPQAALSDGPSLIKARCAECHAAGVAAAKGGSFALFDAAGKLAPLSVTEKKRMMARTAKGEMPPTPGHQPLTPQELDVLQAFLGNGK